jgi:hypothetical protein
MLTTFSLEDYLRLGANHIESLVDERGRTYFDIFLTDPAEAVFDWPDFVDLPARYWEAAIFVEPFIDRKVESVERLRKWLFSHFKEDGLAYRPESPISRNVAELFDQSRLLYSLVTWHMYAPDDKEIHKHLTGLLSGLHAMATVVDDYAYIKEIGLYFGGTLIRPYVQAGLLLNEPKWIDFAGQLARGIMEHSDLIKADGSFSGHVHGVLSTVAGIVSYSVVRKDDRLLSKAVKAFEYARSISTEFGYVPELAQRKDDLIACETCTIMDYLDAATLLARHVDEKYWDVVEKAVRNHLVESQIRDASWLPEKSDATDSPDIIRKDLRKKVIGSFAGWSSPNGLLAYEELQLKQWVKSEEAHPTYLNKIRAVQNCCAGAGLRAIYSAWSNIMLYKDDMLSINMLIDRQNEYARLTSYLPYEGKVLIELKRDCSVRFRIPATCKTHDMQIFIDGRETPVTVDGTYVVLGRQKADTRIEVTFPLEIKSERVCVGNAGFHQYKYNITWKGDTVVAIQPDLNNAKIGYSGLMEQNVRLFYGPDNPAPIYRRGDYIKENITIEPSSPVTEEIKVDWYRLNK